MSTRRLLLALAALAPLALSACGSDDDGGSGASTAPTGVGPKVVATTSIVGDLVGNIAGDRADVSTMLPVSADPHDYEPRPSDVKAVAEADMVVRSGGDLDEWLDDVVTSAGGDATQVDLIESAKTREGGEHHEEGEHSEEEGKHSEEEGKHAEGEEHAHEEGIDPHWWQSPANAVLTVEAIRAALVKADPDGADTYNANAKAYTAELEALDGAISECMERIPAAQRKLVTNHDAFGYFADRYDIEVVGTVIPGLSTQSQASAGEVTDLVRTIEEEKVRTIFAENTVNQQLEQAIAKRSGAEVGPALWSDSLGKEGSTGATYLDMVRFNADALSQGFTGDAGCGLTSS